MTGYGSYPQIYNKTLTNADTEYHQDLPDGTRRFVVGCQDGTQIRIAFEAGYVATPTVPYYTLLANQIYESPDLDGNATLTVYAACSTPGKVLQIIAWQ